MTKMTEKEQEDFRKALIQKGIDPALYEANKEKLSEIEAAQNLKWNALYLSITMLLLGGMIKFFPNFLIETWGSLLGIGLFLSISLVVYGYLLIRDNFKKIYGIDLYSKEMVFPTIFTIAIYCFLLLSSFDFWERISMLRVKGYEHYSWMVQSSPYPLLTMLSCLFFFALLLLPFIFGTYLDQKSK